MYFLMKFFTYIQMFVINYIMQLIFIKGIIAHFTEIDLYGKNIIDNFPIIHHYKQYQWIIVSSLVERAEFIDGKGSVHRL